MVIDGLIGDAYASLGGDLSALTSYREAHRLCSAFNDLDMKASLELRMARVTMYNEHFDEALSYLQSSSSYYGGKGGGSAAVALRGIGEVYLRQKKFDLAQTAFTQARSITQKGDQVILDAQLRMDVGNRKLSWSSTLA
jgi:predicted negative regulator of RcsB-dependent stress response